MDEADNDYGFGSAQPPPFLLSLTPFAPAISPSPRRLSSCFTEPGKPVRSARKLAWISLQGRLVGAEEASSARAIGGGLRQEEAVAWEMFSPIHRVLIVAVLAYAVAESKKSKQVLRLTKAVEFRDQILLSMQHKLDDLCDQLNNVKGQPETGANMSSSGNIDFRGCGCCLCEQHQDLSGVANSGAKVPKSDEMLQYKFPLLSNVDQEERRMSDLSDWASSVTSTAEVQMMNTLSIDQDIQSLRRESEEKDATIKELSSYLHSSNITGAKRISELEDIVRRKNMIISKLKRDMVVLEQKMVHLTRLRRPSYSAPASTNGSRLPFMADNIIYDMDSSTSPSSSDSECAPKNQSVIPVAKIIPHIPAGKTSGLASRRNQKYQKSAPPNLTSSSVRPTERHHPMCRPVSPLKEKSLNQRPDRISSLGLKQSSANGDPKRNRRQAQSGPKLPATQKRWV